MSWDIVDKFNGYRNKSDKSKLPPGILVDGSKNVVFTDDDLITTRKGYTILGATSTATTQIEASTEWDTSTGVQRALRAYDDELEVLIGTTWTRILDGWTAVDFQFTENNMYWDTDEDEDILFFVNGDSNLYSWSGGLAVIASTTSNTITKTGTATWGEARFITDGSNYDKTVEIDGTTYTYTGGESTTTLTGVTPDPSGETDGDNVIQSPTTHTNKPSTGLTNDIISCLNGQLYVGSLTSNLIYLSKVNDFTNYTPTATRLVGEGTSFSLDAPAVGFQTQESVMYISAGKSQWYQIVFELSSDNTAEEVQIKRLKSGVDQGALSQSAIGTIKNSIVFISNEPALNSLGRIENVNTPELKNLSDPIKVDFDYYTWTGSHIKFYKNNLYITVPSNDTLLVYNLERGFWEAPWVMPAGRLAIIDDELVLHSNAAPESYTLLDGYNDNANPIESIARFSYQNQGKRSIEKQFNEWYNEGYIAANTTLQRKFYFDYRGVGGTRTHEFEGTSKKVLSLPGPGGIGKSGLGKDNFAGSSDQDDLRKFRWIDEESPTPYYEMLVEYSSNDIDQRWSILAFGGDIDSSDTSNAQIKE